MAMVVNDMNPSARATAGEAGGEHSCPQRQSCADPRRRRECAHHSANNSSTLVDPQQSGLHELAQLTALAVQHRCEEQREFEQQHQSAFHSSHIPGISVWNYVRRIGKYSCCSPECFIMCVIFIDRYAELTQSPITFRNIHRLLITSMLVSVKLRDDSFYSNSYFASIGGVSNEELNRLEIEFLMTINWHTWVEPREFDMYCERLRSRYAKHLKP